jgi:hypothetical protein
LGRSILRDQATTVTVRDGADTSVSGAVALSVTLSSKLYVSPTVSVPPAIVQVTVPDEAPEPLLTAHWVARTYAPPLTETHHCHEYFDVPDEEILPVTVRSWLTTSRVWLTFGAAGAVRADFTVTFAEADDVFDSTAWALSETASLKL